MLGNAGAGRAGGKSTAPRLEAEMKNGTGKRRAAMGRHVERLMVLNA